MRTKDIKDIIVGDKLMIDIIGYKNKRLLNRGDILSFEHVEFLKKQLVKKKQIHPSIKFKVGLKSNIDIKDRGDNILVHRGAEITEEALKPLLEEGYTIAEGFSDEIVYQRPQKFEGAWHIEHFNPKGILVETDVMVDEKGDETTTLPEPRAKLVSGVATEKKENTADGEKDGDSKNKE